MRATLWQAKISESQVHTVGFYSPDGTWHTDSDHRSHQAAHNRARALNGRLSQYVYIMGKEAGQLVWHVGWYHELGSWIPVATCSRAEAREMVMALNQSHVPFVEQPSQDNDEPTQPPHPLAGFEYPEGEAALAHLLASSQLARARLLAQILVAAWLPQIESLAQRIVADLNSTTYDALESPEAKQMRLARNIHNLIHSQLRVK